MDFYVKDIMTTDLVTVKENTQIKDVIKILSNNEISGVPIIDQDGYISGVVSFTDIINNESSLSFYKLPFSGEIDLEILEESKFFDQPVSNIMSTELYIAEPGDSVPKIAKIMYENKIHRLLVTEYDKLIGIVTTFDLLKLLATSDETIVV